MVYVRILLMEPNLVAPCGMNCSVCAAYLALKYEVRSKGIKTAYCTGCRPRNKQCAFIKKRCTQGLLEGKIEYCYKCRDFPCVNLQKLDTRYRANYRTSLIENLIYIRDEGIDAFLKSEEIKWRCRECSETVSCHNGVCYNCHTDKLAGKPQYRWD